MSRVGNYNRYWRRRAAGLCKECGQPSPETVLCRPCQQRASETHRICCRAWRAKRRASSTCQTCGEDAGDCSRCVTCRRKDAAQRSQRRRRAA